ncbi:MAG: lema family protein [Variovorax sp.]|nr:lema family protein [Variovorax sp.]
MSAVPDSWAYWVGGALLLFWFVGAYNRMIRLRSAAFQAYATLDAALVRQLEFVQANAAAGAESLLAATTQLTTLVAATRVRPLDPERIEALGTALNVLLSAWQRLHPDDVVSFDAEGTMSRPAPLKGVDEEPPPPSRFIAWPEPSAAAEIARGQFNAAVAQYNAAIRQFPALLIAWIMRLRPAAPLL